MAEALIIRYHTLQAVSLSLGMGHVSSKLVGWCFSNWCSAIWLTSLTQPSCRHSGLFIQRWCILRCCLCKIVWCLGPSHSC